MVRMAAVEGKGWNYHIEGDSPYHVWPKDDLVEHDYEDTEGNCICGPSVEPVEGQEGYIGWLIMHYALDGRE